MLPLPTAIHNSLSPERVDIFTVGTIALPADCMEDGNSVSWTEKYERLNE
jgi:hypothetical protein